MGRIVGAIGGIPYWWEDGAGPTWVSSPSAKSNIAADGTIIMNTADPDGETTAASGTSDAASTPGPAQADNPTTTDNAFNRIRLCIVYRPKYDDWSQSRGKIDPNESHRRATVCEIDEESGLPVELGPYLGDIKYPLSKGGRKQRHTKGQLVDTKHIQFWMAMSINVISNLWRTHAFGPVRQADIDKADKVLWLTPAEARKKLSHSINRDILVLFIDRVQEGVPDAMPVVIVHHSKAEARKLWKGSDANHPVAPRDAAAAYVLNRKLACFNLARLATSPWVRCQEMLEMFTWQTGRDMVRLDPLTEGVYAVAPDTAQECLLNEIEFALRRRQPVVVCMHRPVIDGMFGHLRNVCVAPSLNKRLVTKTSFMPAGTIVTLFVTPTPHDSEIIDTQKVQPLVYQTRIP